MIRMTDAQGPWAAVVLSGGRARRLDGVPKHEVRVGGRTLLDRTLDAVVAASEIVVVGEGNAAPGVLVIREDPAFAGPAAAIGAALAHVQSPRVAVVACDHPFVAEAIDTLMAAEWDGTDGVIAVDSTGRRQNLLFTASSSALHQAIAHRKSLVDVAAHELLADLELREIAVSERSLLDVDTWDDHAKLEEIDAGPD
jgi:molybdopterin-guanine dinucleotide biosynthesis protein A